MAVILAPLGGCARHLGPMTYRLFATSQSRLLVPPGVRDPSVAEARLKFPAAREAKACSSDPGALEVQQRKRKLSITVHAAELSAQSPGWLIDWSTSFESRGCIDAGSALLLATRIAQAVPLEMNRAPLLLHANTRIGGYTDLRPGDKLKLISPVLREGTPPGAPILQTETVEAAPGGLSVVVRASPDLLGYESAWYLVEPRSTGNGSRLLPEFAELNQQGAVTRQPAPRVDYLSFDPSMAFFRVLFMSRRTASDRDIFVLAAASRPHLDEQTRLLEHTPGSCPPTTRHADCRATPQGVGVIPFLSVTLNGEQTALAPGTGLRQALIEAGVSDFQKALATLQVQKPYGRTLSNVEFSRASEDILRLQLEGGEVVSW